MLYYTLDNNPEVLQTDEPLITVLQKLTGKRFKLLANATDSPLATLDDYPDSNPRRNFVVLQFERVLLPDVLPLIKSNLFVFTHFVYHNGDNYVRIIIEVDKMLGHRSYKTLVQNLSKQFGFKSTVTYTKINKPINFSKFAQKDIIECKAGKPMPVDDTDMTDPDRLLPNQKKLMAATDDFLRSDQAQKILHDRTQATNFFDTIAASYIDKMINRKYINITIDKIAKLTKYDIKNWQNLFNERLQLMRDNPDLKENTAPFGSYVHLYTQANNATNVAQQLKAMLPSGTKADADYELSEAGSFIEMAFPPYLLDQHGTDLDNLVVFDASSGFWTHDDDTFKRLLMAIRPYSTDNQFNTFKATFAAKAGNANRYIKPYSGSRYLLFNNCVLDVATMKTYDLSDSLVRDLHFTERSKIHLDYVENPPLPQLPQMRLFDNGMWNPRDFLMAYANNKYDRYTYFLFGLSLGLFGGHNFGVHFDIQGESRWGKTTLSEIYQKLYDFNIVKIPFPNLNGQFAFTSYPSNTSVIWINENNVGTEPLDDANGTIVYDGLAEDEVRFQVKKNGDKIVSNPPQVYIDGTQFIKAKELYTGPAGRTLAFKLPPMTNELRNQAYAKKIRDAIQNKRVLQWMVYNFIMAYKEIVPISRMDDLKLNLATETDLQLFPQIARDWRKEFVIGGSTIDDWFADQVEPYLSTNPTKPTYMHPSILYEMYYSSYQQENPNDYYGRNAKTRADLIQRLKTIWASEDDKFIINDKVGSVEKGRPKPRKMIASPDKMNFDWAEFDQDYPRPEKLQSPGYNNLGIFGKKSSGWISIVKIEKKKPTTDKNK